MRLQDENKLFEFKFTQRLTNSHKLQLLFYMYMKQISQPMESATIGLLINARTGEMWQGTLECTPSEAILFLENLLFIKTCGRSFFLERSINKSKPHVD